MSVAARATSRLFFVAVNNATLLQQHAKPCAAANRLTATQTAEVDPNCRNNARALLASETSDIPPVNPIFVKPSDALRESLVEEARRRAVSQSTIVREALEKVLKPAARQQSKLSCLDLAGDLVGSMRSGRRDIATKKALLAEALLFDARRGRKRRR